jgi:hypothetical protein
LEPSHGDQAETKNPARDYACGTIAGRAGRLRRGRRWPEDLARLLLVEFAITYCNDRFVMPIELPVGSLCRADSLVVTNTLGERFVIRSSAESGAQAASWRMFQLAQPSLDTSSVMNAGFFLLPPSLVRGVEPRPVEEVLFLRDEMANMAWGVERVIESEQTSNTLRYRLATEVPDYWIPLLPVQGPAGLRLRRGWCSGRMARGSRPARAGGSWYPTQRLGTDCRSSRRRFRATGFG